MTREMKAVCLLFSETGTEVAGGRCRRTALLQRTGIGDTRVCDPWKRDTTSPSMLTTVACSFSWRHSPRHSNRGDPASGVTRWQAGGPPDLEAASCRRVNRPKPGHLWFLSLDWSMSASAIWHEPSPNLNIAIRKSSMQSPFLFRPQRLHGIDRCRTQSRHKRRHNAAHHQQH